MFPFQGEGSRAVRTSGNERFFFFLEELISEDYVAGKKKKKLLYLCEGLALVSVDLIPKPRKPFALLRGACLEPVFPTACTTHLCLRRRE